MGAGRVTEAKQHLGGVANDAGNTFERHFAIWRIFEAVLRAQRSPASKLACQLKNCRVDDWAEDDAQERRLYSLKRVKGVSWSDAIRSAFVDEHTKSASTARRLHLVVAHARALARLKRSRRRLPCVELMLFGASLRPRVRWRDRQTGAVLRRLSVSGQPTDSDLERMWSAIGTAWENARKPGYFVALHAVLNQLPDQTFPFVLPWEPTADWYKAEKLLSRVPGLKFVLNGGHFSYDFGDGLRGGLSCRTSHFKEFIERVLKHRPTTSNDLRGLL